jgi:DNA-directed RNA polymerase subunit L/DNA-directed RNA polymerase alpha subunit
MFENVQQIDNRTTKFTLTPFHVTYANTLRRVIVSGVETVGFRADMTEKGTTTDVQVTKNHTPMTNEMLADRVGLVPLHVRDPLTWDPDRYIFRLNVENTQESPLDVVAGNFEVLERRADSDEPVPVPTEQFFPPNPLTKETALIAALRGKVGTAPTGEAISLTAKATVGTGRQHARFIPVSQCSYEYTRDSNPDRIKEYFNDWLVKSKKVSPDDLQEGSEKKAALEREFNTMAIARCYKVDERGEANSFDFTIESIGVLSVSYIVDRACQVIEDMCNRYANVRSGALPEELTVLPAANRLVGFDFIFRGHDHTLGNMLQTWLVDNHIGETAAEPKITYAGYYLPHNLRDEMVLRVGVEDGQEATARAAVAAAARGCAAFFKTVRDEWRQVNGMRAPRPVVAAAAAAAAAPPDTSVAAAAPSRKPKLTLKAASASRKTVG